MDMFIFVVHVFFCGFLFVFESGGPRRCGMQRVWLWSVARGSSPETILFELFGPWVGGGRPLLLAEKYILFPLGGFWGGLQKRSRPVSYFSFLLKMEIHPSSFLMVWFLNGRVQLYPKVY